MTMSMREVKGGYVQATIFLNDKTIKRKPKSVSRRYHCDVHATASIEQTPRRLRVSGRLSKTTAILNFVASDL